MWKETKPGWNKREQKIMDHKKGPQRSGGSIPLSHFMEEGTKEQGGSVESKLDCKGPGFKPVWTTDLLCP